jgi:hypothetical protein
LLELGIKNDIYYGRGLIFLAKYFDVVSVPDKRSRVLEVIVVRRMINLGTGNLERGGNGKGLRKGRSAYK